MTIKRLIFIAVFYKVIVSPSNKPKTCVFGNDAATDNAIAIHDIIHPSRSKTNECIITIENNYSFFLFLQPDSLEKGFLKIGFTSR